jgi:hypothetical protein
MHQIGAHRQRCIGQEGPVNVGCERFQSVVQPGIGGIGDRFRFMVRTYPSWTSLRRTGTPADLRISATSLTINEDC